MAVTTLPSHLAKLRDQSSSREHPLLLGHTWHPRSWSYLHPDAWLPLNHICLVFIYFGWFASGFWSFETRSYVAWTDLELESYVGWPWNPDPPMSTSQVLGWHGCATMPSFLLVLSERCPCDYLSRMLGMQPMFCAFLQILAHKDEPLPLATSGLSLQPLLCSLKTSEARTI